MDEPAHPIPVMRGGLDAPPLTASISRAPGQQGRTPVPYGPPGRHRIRRAGLNQGAAARARGLSTAERPVITTIR